MRTCLVSLLTLVPLLGLAAGAHAHIGDQIYPFFELLDEDLHRIDLTDGSVEDWYEVLGEPSLTPRDFFWPLAQYDPASVDNRFWLAWHRSSGTLWVAMERADDLYVNDYGGEIAESGLHLMFVWDGYLSFMVDGDHSGGGRYWFPVAHPCGGCPEEQEAWLMDNRHAQHWMAIAEAADGPQLACAGAADWVEREPYAAAGGALLGSTVTVTEMKVTPFDDLIYDDEDASRASELYPGKVIGFSIHTTDNDDRTADAGTWNTWLQVLSGRWEAISFADLFVDGLLIGAGENPSRYDGDEDSAVEPSSWARIKAALR